MDPVERRIMSEAVGGVEVALAIIFKCLHQRGLIDQRQAAELLRSTAATVPDYQRGGLAPLMLTQIASMLEDDASLAPSHEQRLELGEALAGGDGLDGLRRL
jgi:hypothetical protein